MTGRPWWSVSRGRRRRQASLRHPARRRPPRHDPAARRPARPRGRLGRTGRHRASRCSGLRRRRVRASRVAGCGSHARPAACRRPPRRRIGGALLVTLLVLDVVAILGLGPDRWVAVTRNLLFPGLGLLETNATLGLAFVALALFALLMWVRWGAAWMVAAVWLSGVIVALAVVAPTSPQAAAPIAVARPAPCRSWSAPTSSPRSCSSWLLSLGRGPGWLDSRASARSCVGVGAAGRKVSKRWPALPRSIALGPRRSWPSSQRLGADVPDPAAIVAEVQAPDMARRAKRVALVARWHLGGDPLRGTTPRCAPRWPSGARSRRSRWRISAPMPATNGPACPPASPGGCGCWTARSPRSPSTRSASRRRSERWQVVTGSVFALRGGHRPSCAYAPLAVAGPWAPDVGARGRHCPRRSHGARRSRTGPPCASARLGAAARGPSRPDDERLIAAGRIHARLAGDRDRQPHPRPADPRRRPARRRPRPRRSRRSAQAPGRGRAGATSAGCASNGPRTWRLGSFERALPSRPNRGG